MLLLKVLGWQGEHSVGDVGSCPAGHGAGSTHVVDPSRLNVPSVQGVQSSADKDSLNMLAWQGEHSVEDVGSCPAGHVAAVSIVIGTSVQPSQLTLHVFVPVGGVIEVEVMQPLKEHVPSPADGEGG